MALTSGAAPTRILDKAKPDVVSNMRSKLLRVGIDLPAGDDPDVLKWLADSLAMSTDTLQFRHTELFLYSGLLASRAFIHGHTVSPLESEEETLDRLHAVCLGPDLHAAPCHRATDPPRWVCVSIGHTSAGYYYDPAKQSHPWGMAFEFSYQVALRLFRESKPDEVDKYAMHAAIAVFLHVCREFADNKPWRHYPGVSADIEYYCDHPEEAIPESPLGVPRRFAKIRNSLFAKEK